MHNVLFYFLCRLPINKRKFVTLHNFGIKNKKFFYANFLLTNNQTTDIMKKRLRQFRKRPYGAWKEPHSRQTIARDKASRLMVSSSASRQNQIVSSASNPYLLIIVSIISSLVILFTSFP